MPEGRSLAGILFGAETGAPAPVIGVLMLFLTIIGFLTIIVLVLAIGPEIIGLGVLLLICFLGLAAVFGAMAYVSSKMGAPISETKYMVPAACITIIGLSLLLVYFVGVGVDEAEPASFKDGDVFTVAGGYVGNVLKNPSNIYLQRAYGHSYTGRDAWYRLFKRRTPIRYRNPEPGRGAFFDVKLEILKPGRYQIGIKTGNKYYRTKPRRYDRGSTTRSVYVSRYGGGRYVTVHLIDSKGRIVSSSRSLRRC